MPFNNEAWLSWLDENKDFFKKQMDTAPKGRRRINTKIQTDYVYSDLTRSKPAKSQASAWEVDLQTKLLGSPPGFFALKLGSAGEPRMEMFFHTSLKRSSLVVPCLEGTGVERRAALHADLCSSFVSLSCYITMLATSNKWEPADPVQLVALDVTIRSEEAN
eukprot:4809755-Amphidinium_carterae.3